MAGREADAFMGRLDRVEELRDAGRSVEAIAEMELVVSELSSQLGADDSRSLGVRCGLAWLWCHDGPDASRIERAEALVGDCERVLGLDDPVTIESRHHLVQLMSLNGMHDEAIAAAGRAVSHATRSFGDHDPRTFVARRNGAAALIRAGRANDATTELERLLADMTQSGCGEEQLLTVRRLLAFSHRAAGRMEAAQEELASLLGDYIRLLGPGSPFTREVADALEDASRYRGPFVASSGTSPRPWVFVADGHVPGGPRFAPPGPLPASAPLRPFGTPPRPSDSTSERPDAIPPGAPGDTDGASPAANDGVREGDAGEPDTVAQVGVLAIGPLEIVGWDRPAEREAQLAEILSYLVFHRDHPVRPAALRLALRPDLDDEISEETLRAYLSHLRRAVGQDLLPRATRDGYRIADGVSSDWERFSALAGPGADTSQLEEALGLVRGRPFAGVPDGSFKWVDAELVVSTMETAVADAARRLVTLVMTTDPERAGWAVRQGLLAAPFDWELWRLHLQLAAARGPVALTRARKEAQAVLGDDASSLSV